MLIKKSLRDMYPIKHPFIYECRMKLTGNFPCSGFGEESELCEANMLFSSSNHLMMNLKTLQLEQIRKGILRVGNLSSLFTLCYHFHCFRKSLERRKIFGKWNKDMFQPAFGFACYWLIEILMFRAEKTLRKKKNSKIVARNEKVTIFFLKLKQLDL